MSCKDVLGKQPSKTSEGHPRKDVQQLSRKVYGQCLPKTGDECPAVLIVSMSLFSISVPFFDTKGWFLMREGNVFRFKGS